MTIAPIQKRVLAFITDFVIFLILFFIAYFILSGRYQPLTGQDGMGYSYGIVISKSIYLMMIVSWTVFVALMEYRGGQSLGKRFLKIEVVRQDGAKVSLMDTLTRHLFDLVDLVLFPVFIFAVANRRSQRIGDLLAKTVVVKK